MITKGETDEFELKREKAMKVSFTKLQELMQRNVDKNYTHRFTQYTKDLLKQYIQNPERNIETLREISRFLERNSMLYKKLIMYYATMPLFNYNMTQINDMISDISNVDSLTDYEKVLKRFEKFDIKKFGYNAIYNTIRDGMYVAYCYDSKENGIFMLPLDIAYLRIYGKTPEGQWIVYMDATFFDAGANKEYVESDIGGWDDVFKQGYKDYKKDNKNRWFRLPSEKTFCMLSCPDDEFYMPLPFFLPLFCPILDLLDLQEILQSKTELENYKLIVNKIPLISNSDSVDDLALSLELVKAFDTAMQNVVPDLVGIVSSPCDVDTIEFNSSASTNDTDELSKSIQNIFNNAGASQLVVAGGASTNSVGLNHAIRNDQATCWFFVNQFESWLNFFIHKNISKNYQLEIHRITWYNESDYIQQMKDIATLGGSALDFLTARGDTPYRAYQKLRFENAIGIKDIMIPLQSSYNMGAVNKTAGAPEKSEDNLTPEGAATRDGNKNDGTKANE